MGKEARVRGYETMTGVSATDSADGSNLFPSITQNTTGLFVRKSNSADAVIRPWIVVADQRTFYMFALTGDTAGKYSGWMFGEYYSFKTNDPGRTILIARGAENSGVFSYEFLDVVGFQNLSITNNAQSVARDPTGAVGAVEARKTTDFGLSTSGSYVNLGLDGLAFTNPADNRIYLSPVRVHTVSPFNTLRGRLRGLWNFMHPAGSVTDGDTFTGVGDLAGKSFLVIKQAGNGGGCYILETSNTWDTN
jgi:hypothetical protein